MKKYIYFMLIALSVLLLVACDKNEDAPDIESVVLDGEYVELSSLLWKGDVVPPGLVPGMLADGKEFYLFFSECPYLLSEGDSIRVEANVSVEQDLRGITYNKAVVTRWLDAD